MFDQPFRDRVEAGRLLGAELNAEIEHQTAEDSTVGGNKPLGARDANVADTIGAAKA